MAIIAKYLTAKRQRLIDLFSQADKDKNWMLTRIEFKRSIKEVSFYTQSKGILFYNGAMQGCHHTGQRQTGLPALRATDQDFALLILFWNLKTLLYKCHLYYLSVHFVCSTPDYVQVAWTVKTAPCEKGPNNGKHHSK